MKKKTILLLLTGFSVGLMMQESISQLRWRNVAIGGELFFIPMVGLLVWFGWTLRDEFKKSNVRSWKMVIHAENEQQKRMAAQHICTGAVCKNCLNFSKSIIFPGKGYCMFFNKSGLSYNDFCSLFKKDVRIDD